MFPLRGRGDSMQIYDLFTGNHMRSIKSRTVNRCTSHWLLMDLKTASVQCLSLYLSAMVVELSFGQWRHLITDRDISVFTNGSDCLIWNWLTCSGVRSEDTIKEDTRIAEVNGAVFIIQHSENTNESRVSVVSHPAWQFPEPRMRLVCRVPPAELPDDAPFVPQRQVLRADGFVSVLPPQGSDVHAPLLYCEPNFYRFEA